MKKSKNLFIAFGFVAALGVGFLIGISVNYPRVDTDEISGTIGKVNNYRNARNSKTEIQLQNELTSDSVKLRSLQNYLQFYYLTSVKMALDIQFTINEVNAVEALKAANQSQIASLTSYEKFLSSTRPDLLLAVSACQTPEGTDPVLLKDVLNQANNVVAQMNFRNRAVLDFIDVLAAFINTNKAEEFPGLKRAHDLLALNELNSAIVTRDKLVLKSLDKKTLFTDTEKLRWFDQQNLNQHVQQDVEKLGRILDAEKLGLKDTEKLGGIEITDAEKLGGIEITDTEKLGSLLLNSEKLGSRLLDIEKLGSGGFPGHLADAEKLGVVNDSENLGLYCDSEALGALLGN